MTVLSPPHGTPVEARVFKYASTDPSTGSITALQAGGMFLKAPVLAVRIFALETPSKDTFLPAGTSCQLLRANS